MLKPYFCRPKLPPPRLTPKCGPSVRPRLVVMLITPPNAFRPNTVAVPGRISIRSMSSIGIKSKLMVLKSGSLILTPSTITTVVVTGWPLKPRMSTVDWKSLPT